VLICAIGALISMLAFASALLLVIRSVVFGGLLEGWPSLIVSIWLLGGLAILSTGVVGLYLATVFVEVKQRPFSIVRGTYGWPDSRPLALERRGQARQEARQE
jgi:putative glycosyltransferase